MQPNIGIDLIEVSRIERAIKRYGDHFLNRVFDPTEITYARQCKDPSQHLAARFAAKEAVYKALNHQCEGLSWRQIVVESHGGRPVCRVNHSQFQGTISVSLSHTKAYAVACAVVAS